jgi:hypothetical protein
MYVPRRASPDTASDARKQELIAEATRLRDEAVRLKKR